MAEEYVNKEEFNILKQDVEKIKEDMRENTKVLTQMDKKLDVITERLTTADKIDDLKLNPLEKRVEKIENTQTWLWRTIGATLIGMACKIIFDISNYVK